MTAKWIVSPQAVSIGLRQALCSWDLVFSLTARFLVFLQYTSIATAKLKETFLVLFHLIVLPLPWTFPSLALSDWFFNPVCFTDCSSLTHLRFCKFLFVFQPASVLPLSCTCYIFSLEPSHSLTSPSQLCAANCQIHFSPWPWIALYLLPFA